MCINEGRQKPGSLYGPRYDAWSVPDSDITRANVDPAWDGGTHAGPTLGQVTPSSKLNDDNTELIIIITSEITSRHEDIVLNIGDSLIAPVWNHPGTLVFCLIQPVVLMIMWTKFAKMLTISCIPSVKFKSTLTNPRLKNDKFGSDIPLGLLQ